MSANGLPEVVDDRRAVTDVGFGLSSDTLHEDAYHTEWNGRSYVCPRTPRLRMLEGLLAVRAASSQLGKPLFSEALAAEARTRLTELRNGDHGTSHILTSAWHVPVRWFVPFVDSEREVVRDAYLRIRYRQTVGTGIGRLLASLEILRKAGLPTAITEDVEQLRVWLSEFPSSAMVELDYGSVSQAFDETELITDESAAELWASLDALACDDWNTAGERYGALVSRWAVPMAIGYSN